MESITLADQTTINTANELFDAIHTNSFYKLSTGFYPFVFTYVCPRWHFEMADAHSGLRHFLNKIWYTLMLQDGVCVAHGLDDVHVGSTLPQIIANLGIDSAPADLNVQFRAAAENEGASHGLQCSRA